MKELLFKEFILHIFIRSGQPLSSSRTQITLFKFDLGLAKFDKRFFYVNEFCLKTYFERLKQFYEWCSHIAMRAVHAHIYF